MRRFFVDSHVHFVFQHSVETDAPNQGLKLWIALEDAQEILRDTNHGESSGLATLLGVVRGAGLGVFALIQSTYGLNKSIWPNLGLKILGRCGSCDDYLRMGAEIGLDSTQLQWAQRNLKPGLGITKLSNSDWVDPILFTIPDIQGPLPKISDAQADETIRELDYLPTEFDERYLHWTPYETIIIQPKEPSEPEVQLSDMQRRLLEIIVQNPGLPSGKYPKLAKVNGKKAAEIRRHLVQLHFVREHKVQTNLRGRSSILLEPTPEGISIINKK